MNCNVVAVSRAFAAEGEEVAGIVARELKFRYVDHEIIEGAAEAAGVSPEIIAQAEHTEPLIARIFATLAASSVDPGMMHPVVTPTWEFSNEYGIMMEHVIRKTADAGQAVIVAHAASIPLAGTPGLLRVLITGSTEIRTKRLVEAKQLGEREAAKAIQESDRQRAQYLKRFYNVSRELPTHYDLVINTDYLSNDDAARIVLAAAKSD